MNNPGIIKINKASIPDASMRDGYLNQVIDLACQWHFEVSPQDLPDEQTIRQTTAQYYREGVEAGDTYIIAVDQTSQEAVGYAAVEQSVESKNELHYGLAYVVPGERRKGIFARMSEEVIATAREQGAGRLTAFVNSEDASEQGLRALGFTEYARHQLPDGNARVDLEMRFQSRDPEKITRFIP